MSVRFLGLIMIAAAWFGLQASAAIAATAPEFRRVQLTSGISIDVPVHWYFIEEASRKNLTFVGRTIAEASGLEGLPQKIRVLAVNATPAPTGAMIGVSVSWPPDYTQEDLVGVSRRDLRELERELFSYFRHAEPHGGPHVLEMQSATVEPFGEGLALVLRYRRASQRGPSPWQVTQYKIPVNSGMIELTLSHRESDAPVWRPILAHVKQSVRLPH